jgi:hypothetical protein
MAQPSARCALWIALAACSAFGQTAASQLANNAPVAYVFEIKGHWKTQRVADLPRGAALHDKDLVEPREDRGARAGYQIFVGFVDGRVEQRDCGESGTGCTTLEIVLNKGTSEKATTYSERLQRIWESLTLAELPKAVLNMSRGRRMRDDPSEAVLSVERGQPELAPALLSMPPGTFSAELTPLANTGGPVRLSVQWTPPKALVTGPSVNPGLYQLKLLNAGAESNPVTVLLAPSARAGALRSDFAALAQVARDWPDTMTSARHDYFTAVLTQLTRQSPAGK